MFWYFLITLVIMGITFTDFVEIVNDPEDFSGFILIWVCFSLLWPIWIPVYFGHRIGRFLARKKVAKEDFSKGGCSGTQIVDPKKVKLPKSKPLTESTTPFEEHSGKSGK